MERSVYAVESEVERDHWWFVGRRRLFSREILKAGIRRDAHVLDVGVGSGSNLRMLRDLGFATVVGLDPSADAAHYCNLKGLGPVQRGDICAMPFPGDQFDLILATDVIEHVEEDRKALKELARVLKPGGTVIITVPTFPSLWGLQDEVAHHVRRYRLNALVSLVTCSGLVLRRRYYFNYLLFVPIWLARQFIRVMGIDARSENEFNSPTVNRFLLAIFNLDVATAPILRPPFGVSALVIAQKTL